MMLTKIREASSGWVGRLILGILVSFLILSFGIWGISDVFRGFGADKLAHVGKTDVSTEVFQQELERERRTLSTRTGKGITNDQLRAYGIPEQVMLRLMTQATLDETARRLQISLSEGKLLEDIINDPDLRGPLGNFDKTHFQRLLRENGYTEASYIAQRRTLARRMQVSDFTSSGILAPDLYAQMVHRYQQERRTASYVILASDQMDRIAPPSDEVLRSYFDITRAAFAAPEYRQAQILTLTPLSVMSSIKVEDAEVQAAYDAQAAQMNVPEKRALQQLVFADRAEAEAARSKIATGSSFAVLAKELGKKNEDIDLGTLAQSQMLDPALAEAAFKLAAQETSAVLERPLGFILLHVARIDAGVQKSFEQVKKQLHEQLVFDRAKKRSFDLYDKIEDDRSSGLKLQEIAQKYQLALTEIAAITPQGLDDKGAMVQGIEAREQVLDGLFKATPNAFEADALSLSGGKGYVWYDVLNVTKARERPLDEVKDAVIARWIGEQERRVLSEKAMALLSEIKTGKPLKDVAAAMKLNLRQTASFSRTDKVPDFSAAGVEDVFRTPKDGSVTTLGDAARTRLVFTVMESQTSPAPALDANLKIDLERSYSESLLAAYLEKMEAVYGTQINNGVLNRLIGASSSGARTTP